VYVKNRAVYARNKLLGMFLSKCILVCVLELVGGVISGGGEARRAELAADRNGMPTRHMAEPAVHEVVDGGAECEKIDIPGQPVLVPVSSVSRVVMSSYL
jgi:hypothetical protein